MDVFLCLVCTFFFGENCFFFFSLWGSSFFLYMGINFSSGENFNFLFIVIGLGKDT